jgi:hypothetical protein
MDTTEGMSGLMSTEDRQIAAEEAKYRLDYDQQELDHLAATVASGLLANPNNVRSLDAAKIARDAVLIARRIHEVVREV